MEKFLSPGDEVLICTTKPDKYDRYLADVFVATKDALDSAASNSSLVTVPALSLPKGHSSLFLNNSLLSAGHATRYDGGAKEV